MTFVSALFLWTAFLWRLSPPSRNRSWIELCLLQLLLPLRRNWCGCCGTPERWRQQGRQPRRRDFLAANDSEVNDAVAREEAGKRDRQQCGQEGSQVTRQPASCPDLLRGRELGDRTNALSDADLDVPATPRPGRIMDYPSFSARRERGGKVVVVVVVELPPSSLKRRSKTGSLLLFSVRGPVIAAITPTPRDARNGRTSAGHCFASSPRLHEGAPLLRLPSRRRLHRRARCALPGRPRADDGRCDDGDDERGGSSRGKFWGFSWEKELRNAEMPWRRRRRPPSSSYASPGFGGASFGEGEERRGRSARKKKGRDEW